MSPLSCEVKQKFQQYPSTVAEKLLTIRDIIVKVADALKIGDLEETLKWGEPSYLTKHGSTVRFDWKANTPNNFYIYFNCKTTLVGTIKELYGDKFGYLGNRALVFKLDQQLPIEALKQCFTLALEYKKRRTFPMLGAVSAEI